MGRNVLDFKRALYRGQVSVDEEDGEYVYVVVTQERNGYAVFFDYFAKTNRTEFRRWFMDRDEAIEYAVGCKVKTP